MPGDDAPSRAAEKQDATDGALRAKRARELSLFSKVSPKYEQATLCVIPYGNTGPRLAPCTPSSSAPPPRDLQMGLRIGSPGGGSAAAPCSATRAGADVRCSGGC